MKNNKKVSENYRTPFFFCYATIVEALYTWKL